VPIKILEESAYEPFTKSLRRGVPENVFLNPAPASPVTEEIMFNIL
jgi:hypothetical protein